MMSDKDRPTEVSVHEDSLREDESVKLAADSLWICADVVSYTSSKLFEAVVCVCAFLFARVYSGWSYDCSAALMASI